MSIADVALKIGDYLTKSPDLVTDMAKFCDGLAVGKSMECIEGCLSSRLHHGFGHGDFANRLLWKLK